MACEPQTTDIHQYHGHSTTTKLLLHNITTFIYSVFTRHQKKMHRPTHVTRLLFPRS